jgi:hypothetical protein
MTSSRWHVFHSIISGGTYATQVFAIYDSKGVDALYHSEDLEGATNAGLATMLGQRARWYGLPFTPPTEAELDELRGYIAEWLESIQYYKH